MGHTTIRKIKMIQIYRGIYYLHDLMLNGFIDNGIEITLFVISSENKIEEKKGLIIHHVKCPIIPKPSIIGLRFMVNFSNFLIQISVLLFKVSKYIIKHKNDIDVFYGNKPIGNIIASILRKIFNKPSVSRYYGTLIYPYLHKPLIQKLLNNYAEYFSFKLRSDLTVMNNDGTYGDKVAEYFKIPQDKYRYYFNGIDNISANDRKKKEGKITILSLSRLHTWKRVDRLISAIPQVIKGFNNIEFIIVGEGIEKVKLEKQVKRLGIVDYVKFYGHVPQYEVQGIMQNADIFCSLQDYCNFSKNVMEAMSNYLCVVTIDEGAINEIITNYENGIIIEKDKLKEELHKTIIKLAKDKELRDKLGNNAGKFIKENIGSWEERIIAEVNDIRSILPDR